MESLKLKSPAKINLYLDVLNKRPDGYHEIKTIFERINLFDDISLKNRSDGRIKVSSNNHNLPANSSNLAFKAAELLKRDFSVKRGVQIHIHKRIPVASGLGGGSSNAASVLLGLNRLWGLRLKKDNLQKYAERIGSDVPFFISNNSYAVGSGRGEKLNRLAKLESLWHILVVPNKKLYTKSIYRALNMAPLNNYTNVLTKKTVGANMLIHALRKRNLPLAKEYLFNALENPAVRLCPSIRKIKTKLKDLGVKACALSGSGPAVFGIVSSRKEAEALKRKLSRERKDWQVFAVRTF